MASLHFICPSSSLSCQIHQYANHCLTLLLTQQIGFQYLPPQIVSPGCTYQISKLATHQVSLPLEDDDCLHHVPRRLRRGYTPCGAAAAVEDLPEGGLPPRRSSLEPGHHTLHFVWKLVQGGPPTPQQQLSSRYHLHLFVWKCIEGGSTNPAAAAGTWPGGGTPTAAAVGFLSLPALVDPQRRDYAGHLGTCLHLLLPPPSSSAFFFASTFSFLGIFFAFTSSTFSPSGLDSHIYSSL